MKILFASVLVGVLLGLVPGCNYSTDYFRIGPDGKKIKAEGPIVPGEGEDTSGIGTSGTTTAGGTDGDDGTITPTGGTGTAGTATGGGVVTGTPVYSLLIHSKDDTSKAQNLFLARFSEGAFTETPKNLTSNTEEGLSFIFPALSPDASKVLYAAMWYDSATKKTKGEYRLLKDLAATPTETPLPLEVGWASAWRANGEEVLYIPGGCGLGPAIKKAKADGSNVSTEANIATGTLDKWVYSQATVSPVKDASHPGYDLIVFNMLSAEGATKQGFELFAKKWGDPDQAHFSQLTDTPSTIEFYPSVSPDAKFVAFTSLDSNSVEDAASGDKPAKIAVCDLTYSGGPVQCLNTRTLDVMSASSVSMSPCWAWDGSKIFFLSKDATHKKNDIFMVDFSGGAFGTAATNITNTDTVEEMGLSCSSAQLTK